MKKRGFDVLRGRHIALNAEQAVRGTAAAMGDRDPVTVGHERPGNRQTDPPVASCHEHGARFAHALTLADA